MLKVLSQGLKLGSDVINLLTIREVVWNGVHLVLQHLGMECGDVERLHGVGQAPRQYSIHVHTTAAKSL